MTHIYKIGDKVRRTEHHAYAEIKAGQVGIVVRDLERGFTVSWEGGRVFNYWEGAVDGPDSLDCIEPVVTQASGPEGLDKQQRFEAAVRPLIQWMNENPDICDPHTKIMVTLDSAEFLGGGMFHGTKDFLKG